MGKRDEIIFLSVLAVLICLSCSILTLIMTWDRGSQCQEFCFLLAGLTPFVMGVIGFGLSTIILIKNRNSVMFSHRPWLLSLADCVIIGAVFFL
jgi:hypothetical protein